MVDLIVFCILLLAAFVIYGAWLNARDAAIRATRLREAKMKLDVEKSTYVNALAKSSLSSFVEMGYHQTEEDEEFERWITGKFGESIDKHFYSKVAGVSFENKDGTSRQSLILQCKKYDRIALVPEPENPHGSTAVRVENASGTQLGYLPHSVSVEHSGQIDQWMAVVRHIYPRKADTPAALVICLLRMVAVDNSERAIFEKTFKHGVGKHSDLHFPSRMDRSYGLNEDGSDRQNLIAKCEKNQELYLNREPKNDHDSNSIRVCNESGQLLGYLERRTAAELAPQMDSGRHWAAIVQSIKPSPSGKRVKLRVCVYRLKLESVEEKSGM
jgi:hypothetical protein